MSEGSPAGVLLTAHGTVENLDELPEFLTRIRHGRPAPPELVAEVRRRYALIGGSPLLATTRRVAESLGRTLDLPVFVGMRLWRPEIADALNTARAARVERLCVLPLAPFSVHVYVEAARRALAASGAASPELVAVEPWGTEPGLVAAHAQAIEPLLGSAAETELVLTAHSLPLTVVRGGDPYQALVEAGAAAVAERLGRPFRLAYQSEGAGGGEWLGPRLRSVLEDVLAAGKRRVVVAPIGFLSDHVETLYDLDVEARGWAEELGLELVRVPALNHDARLLETLAAVARRALFR